MKSIGLSIDCRSELGYTPLILAIKSFRFDNAIYLLDHADASPFSIDDEYHWTCSQWAENVGPKSDQWRQNFNMKKPKKYEIDFRRKKNRFFKNFSISNYKSNESLYSNHHPSKLFEESLSTSRIHSPRSKDRKSLSASMPVEKTNLTQTYQQWMKLIQRLHDRTSLHKDHHEKFSSGYKEKVNSNTQVTTLINDYSSILSTDNHAPLIARFMDRPKSILRSRGSMNKYRFTKVTFALN
jgi:hypothetical protein